MPPPPRDPSSKTIFVANIPYDVTEEQLATIFSEVGPVAGFDLKFDPNTGKAKGYGFCHYYDNETALSAVRNLQEVLVSGRNLRVELSTDEPGPRKNRRGPNEGPYGGGAQPRDPGYAAVRGTPAAGPAPGGYLDDRRGPGAAPGAPLNMSALPAGQDIPPGAKATDVISKTLASIPPGKLEEVLLQMKTLVQTSPEQARTVLAAHPQLAYALFQSMLMMNVVEPSILSRLQPIPNPVAAAPAPYGAQPSYGQPPAAPSHYGAPPPQAYPPAPAQYGQPPVRPPFPPTSGPSYSATPPQQYPPAPPAAYSQPPPCTLR